MSTKLNLVTLKRASELTGVSVSFFKQLLREKNLTPVAPPPRISSQRKLFY